MPQTEEESVMFSLLMRQTLSGSRVSLLSFLAVSTKLSRVEDKLDSSECKIQDITTGLGVLNCQVHKHGGDLGVKVSLESRGTPQSLVSCVALTSSVLYTQ